MRLSISTLLVALAIILFIIATLTEEHSFDFLAFGLAVFAASFVAEDVVGGYFRRDTRT